MAGPYNKKNFSAGTATKQLKAINPDGTDEIVQIGLVDTGLTTIPGEKIFAMMVVTPGGGSAPSLPSAIPANPPVAVTGTAAAMPANPLVNSVMLRAPNTNAASVWVGGDNTVAIGSGYELEPGTWVSVPINNLSKIFIIGNPADFVQWIGG